MNGKYIVYRIVEGGNQVSSIETVKPTERTYPAASFGWTHWVSEISGGFPQIWRSARENRITDKQMIDGIMQQVVIVEGEDDPPFVDSRTFEEKRRCGFVMEADPLFAEYQGTLADGDSDNETNPAKVAWQNIRAEIKAKYPKPL